ncbi:MAG: cytochrome P450 [Proteobacteria bacterium]|nr:cytochrome P450 [Pseudomonadota bacterium]
MTQTLEIGINEGERERNRHNALGVVNELHPRFDELRERGDVHRGNMAELFGVASSGPSLLMRRSDSHFTVLGYETADAAFRRHEVFSSRVYEETVMTWGPNLLSMDEPEHRRYRMLAQPAFANKTMQDWESRWLVPILDRLIEGLAHAERADLYMGYCALFPAHTICSSFGIGESDVAPMHDWLLRMLNTSDPEDAARAGRSFAEYMGRVVRERRADPNDDVISLLANSELVDEDGSRHQLTDDEIMGFAGLMLTAGSGTTYRSLGIMLLTLLQRPALLEKVVSDRSLVPQVIEETLRWDPPLTYFSRLATRDTELDGVPMPKGTVVDLSVTAANHDPRRWEDPHEFDPFRPTQPHMGFGSGPHFCIGNQLARMELRVALNRLLDAFPRMQLDPEAPEPFVTGLYFRMPTAVPVILNP